MEAAAVTTMKMAENTLAAVIIMETAVAITMKAKKDMLVAGAITKRGERIIVIANKMINDMENLITEIKEKVIEALNLDGMRPEDIDNDAPLFGDEGLGLDSIDVLELIVFLEKNYGIRLATPQEGKEVFKSIAVMADYVAKNRTK